MHHRQDAHQKGSDNSASARVSPQFQSRPFGLGAQSETITPQQQETPDLQTQLERAKRFGPDFSRVRVRGEGPPPTIQPKLFFGEQRDQEEPVTDAIANPVRSMPAPRVNLGPIQRRDAESVGNQPNPLAARMMPVVQRRDAEWVGMEPNPLAARMMSVVQRQSQPTVSIPRQQWIQRIEQQPEAKLEEDSLPVQTQLENATIERQPEVEQEQEDESAPVQAKVYNSTVQRQREEKDIHSQPSVQRAVEGGQSQSRSSLESRLSEQKGGGSPLDEEVRSFMEPRFGTDFSGVRVHTDSSSVSMNKELGAQAFTHGNDIYFNSGKYNPGSSDGKKLLAHELTHTIQQTGAVQPKSVTKLTTKENKLQAKECSAVSWDALPAIQLKENPQQQTGEEIDVLPGVNARGFYPSLDRFSLSSSSLT